MERGPQAPLPPSPSSARCRGLGSRAEQGEGKIYLHPPSSSPPRVSDSIAPFIILTLLPRTRGPGICPSSLRDLCSREPGWESEGPARRRPACTGRCGRRARCPESVSFNAPPGKGGGGCSRPRKGFKMQKLRQSFTGSDGLFGAHSALYG